MPREIANQRRQVLESLNNPLEIAGKVSFREKSALKYLSKPSSSGLLLSLALVTKAVSSFHWRGNIPYIQECLSDGP